MIASADAMLDSAQTSRSVEDWVCLRRVTMSCMAGFLSVREKNYEAQGRDLMCDIAHTTSNTMPDNRYTSRIFIKFE